MFDAIEVHDYASVPTHLTYQARVQGTDGMMTDRENLKTTMPLSA
jgi:hypothetical protein